MYANQRLLLLASLTSLLLGGCSQVGALIGPSKLLGKPNVDKDRTLALARLTERKGNLSHAEKIYRSMQENEAADPAVLHRIGVVAARQGRLEEARQHFTKSFEAGGQSAELLTDMGYCCYLMDDLPAAEESLRSALELDPNSSRARNNLGLVIGEQGRFGESLAQFKLAGKESEAHANLAYVYSQLGHLQLAAEEYNLALSLDQSLRPAANAMVELASDGRARETVRQYAHARSQMPPAPGPATTAPVLAASQPSGVTVSLAAHNENHGPVTHGAESPTRTPAASAKATAAHREQAPVAFAPSTPNVAPATFVAPVIANGIKGGAAHHAAANLWYADQGNSANLARGDSMRTPPRPASPVPGISPPASQPAEMSPTIPPAPRPTGPAALSTRGAASVSDQPVSPTVQPFPWPNIK